MVPQDLLNKESKKGIEEKKAEKMVKRENLIYETNNFAHQRLRNAPRNQTDLLFEAVELKTTKNQ